MGGTDAPTAGPSLAGRFAAAIALTVGFYLLALGIAGGLLAVAILPWVLGGHGNIWISLTTLVLGVTILVAIVPRRRRFEAPGVLVRRDEQPRLLALIEEESRALALEPPDEVYVNFEANAAVTEAGRRRRVMIVGLPLLHLVSERGLRGIVAHELGHYAGGDTRLGPWIYRTRETIGRTLDRLTDDDGDDGWTQTAIRKPFEWYAKAFMRITAAISRRQEFAADRFAADRAGREVHVDALRRLHAYAPAFDAYWADEVMPALEASRRPPVASGFAAFIRAEAVERVATAAVERELREAETGRYDSHPSLADRIRALEHEAPGSPDESRPAAELVADAPGLERRVFEALFGLEAAAELEAVAWGDVGDVVYLAHARRLVHQLPSVVAGVTAGGLGDAVARSGQLAGEIQRREPDIRFEDAAALAPVVLRDALLVALADAGWEVTAGLAEPVTCRHGGHELQPAAVVGALREGELETEAWAARAHELGIAELALAPAEQPAPEPATGAGGRG
jgi:Zn-dependent protease with chaperone function